MSYPASNEIDDLLDPDLVSDVQTSVSCIAYSLRLSNISPVYERLYGVGYGRLIEILRIECWDLADVAVVQFVEAAGFNDGHSHIRIF